MAAKQTVGIRLDLEVVKDLENLAKSESERTGYQITVADIGRRLIVEGLVRSRASAKRKGTPR